MDIGFFKVSEIIKNYIDTNNKSNPDRKYIKCSGLTINKNNEEPISVSQLQIEEKIRAVASDGIIIDNLTYKKRIDFFIQNAIESKSDLVLTPEYSIPYSVIDDLTNKIEDLKIGALFCMCAQGVKNDEALHYIRIIDNKSNCYVYKQSLNNMDSKDFVCILFYIFKISFFVNEEEKDDILFIIPQLKTMHMKDDSYEFETGHLSTGKDIFYFDMEPEQDYKNIGKCNNIFYSLLCSDVFEYTQYLDFMQKENRGIIIFHPQLNPKPKHGVFLDFRKGAFDLVDKDIVLITATWGAKTKVNSLNFSEPNSAIYEKSNEQNYIDNHINLITQNHIKKITLGVTRNRIKWLFPKNECFVRYSLAKPNTRRGSNLSSVITPFIHEINIYDRNTETFKHNEKCLYTPKDVLYLINDKSPINHDNLLQNLCKDCDSQHCNISDFLYFIGSFFQEDSGDFIEYTLHMSNDEMCNQIRPDNQKQKLVRDNIILLRRFLKCISDDDLPSDLLGLFKMGAYFYVKNGRRKKEIYNISFDNTDKKIRIVCLDEKNEDEVKKIFDKLRMDAEDEEEVNSTILMYTNDCSLKQEFYHEIPNIVDSDGNSVFDISKSDI